MKIWIFDSLQRNRKSDSCFFFLSFFHFFFFFFPLFFFHFFPFFFLSHFLLVISFIFSCIFVIISLCLSHYSHWEQNCHSRHVIECSCSWQWQVNLFSLSLSLSLPTLNLIYNKKEKTKVQQHQKFVLRSRVIFCTFFTNFCFSLKFIFENKTNFFFDKTKFSFFIYFSLLLFVLEYSPEFL